ncbi:response regulator [Novosphingobium olei]|uniref:response regulator n=1 Tax=Novosphingobium olei TaxID=2728851 RepID=UPI0030883CD5|nr:response regulator [Novosphingobium olei]
MASTICLVEDEPLLRAMTQADLEDLGFDVIAANTCEEAWTIISSGTPLHCLLTDIRTPGAIDGWELARLTRDMRPQIGVIYVSGYAGNETKPVAGSIFLSKPYLCRDLEQALATLGVSQ